MSVKFNPTFAQPQSSSSSSPSSSPDLTPELGALIEIIKSFYMMAKFELSHRPSPVQTIYDYMNGEVRSEKGHTVTQMPPYREHVREAEMEVIKEISTKYLRSQQKIMEIGAGKLDANGHSYFMQRLPPEIRNCVEPTEVNRALVDPSGTKLKHIDTLKLAEHYSVASLDRIIGSAVLNTLNDADLEETLKQAHTILNKDGLLIHISSLEPFRNVLLSAYTNDQTVFFPSVNQDENFNGLQVISKEDFIKFLDTTTRVSGHVVKFFRWYVDLPANQREIIIDTLIAEAREPRINSALMTFIKYIAQMSPEGLKFVDNFTFFEERIKAILKKTGFEIVVFENRTKSHTIKRPKTNILPADADCFSMDRGSYSHKSSPALKKTDRVYQQVNMHVIVAKPIPNSQKV